MGVPRVPRVDGNKPIQLHSYSSTEVIKQETPPAPIPFVENVGQFDPRSTFVIQGVSGSVQFAQDAFWMTLPEKEPEDTLSDELDVGTKKEGDEDLAPTPEPFSWRKEPRKRSTCVLVLWGLIQNQ